MPRLIVLALVAFTAVGCAPAVHPVFGEISTGHLTFEHDDRTRQYALHIPANVAEGAPLVLSMHGYTDDAIRHRNYTELNAVADANGFIVAYPRGVLDRELQRFWNIGYFFHQQETVDDVGYLSALTEHLQATYGADPARTFTAGFSNGGDMSYMLACKRPDLFKGFVSVGGLMLEDFKDDCAFSEETPLLEIRGEEDEITLYAGDIDNETGWGRYPHIEETIDFWATRNGCTTVETETLTDDADDRPVHMTRHTDCGGGQDVWLYRIPDYGHEWPQGTDDFYFNASEEVWRFLGRF